MDPLTMALGLSSVIPSIIRWVAGDDAGKVAETAVTLAKQVAGVDDGEQAIAAVKADPALQLQLQTLWANKEVALYQAENERLRIDADDRKNARDMAKTDKWPPRVGALIVLLLWVAVTLSTVVWGLPPGISESMTARVMTLVDTATMLVLYYYYGSSSGSSRKDETIRAMQTK